MLENEDGFTIDLETVYYAGVSNPVHRKAEMMATMKDWNFWPKPVATKRCF